jgi:hypothetical protein
VLLKEQPIEEQAVEVLGHEWADALAWNDSLDRMAQSPDLNPAEFDRVSLDEAFATILGASGGVEPSPSEC